MIKFDRKFCKIYFYEDINTVHLDWGGVMATKKQFIEACETALDIMVENGGRKMIADNSKVPVITIENQDWLTNDWFPRALERGFRYSAVVTSGAAFQDFAVKRIESKINNQLFVVHYFKNFEDARAWISTLS